MISLCFRLIKSQISEVSNGKQMLELSPTHGSVMFQTDYESHISEVSNGKRMSELSPTHDFIMFQTDY